MPAGLHESLPLREAARVTPQSATPRDRPTKHATQNYGHQGHLGSFIVYEMRWSAIWAPCAVASLATTRPCRICSCAMLQLHFERAIQLQTVAMSKCILLLRLVLMRGRWFGLRSHRSPNPSCRKLHLRNPHSCTGLQFNYSSCHAPFIGRVCIRQPRACRRGVRTSAPQTSAPWHKRLGWHWRKVSHEEPHSRRLTTICGARVVLDRAHNYVVTI